METVRDVQVLCVSPAARHRQSLSQAKRSLQPRGEALVLAKRTRTGGWGVELLCWG